MKRPSESPARSHAVAAVIIGLRGNAIATDVPILIRLVCSAINAAGRKLSLPASGIQIASKPAASAARGAAGTSRRLRVERPVSSFTILLPSRGTFQFHTIGGGFEMSLLPSVGSFRRKLFFGLIIASKNLTPNPFPHGKGDR